MKAISGGQSHRHKLLCVISYVSLGESKSSMLIFQRQARDVGRQRNPHNNCKKMTRQHERHTAAGCERLEDALPLKSKLFSVAMATEPIG